jgi:ATP synthase proteolipid subunit
LNYDFFLIGFIHSVSHFFQLGFNLQPELVMRNIIPVVMAGVLGIYGLIVAVVLIQAGQSHHS